VTDERPGMSIALDAEAFEQTRLSRCDLLKRCLPSLARPAILAAKVAWA
jgi:hypothetical protein